MSTLPVDLFKRAVSACDAAEVSRLLAANSDLRTQINAPLFAFETPAMVEAASQDCRPMIDALLEAGADINARSRWWAGSFGVLDIANPELAGYLIGKGAVVDAHSAARLGMFDQLRELISREPALVHARGGDGKMPLHFASTIEIAEYLLAQGADVDALDIDHESTAAQHLIESHPEVARYLVSRGAETDILLAAALGDIGLVTQHLDANPECIHTRVNERFFPRRNPHSGGKIYIWTLGKNRSAHQVARKFGHPEVLKFLMDRSPAKVRLVNAFSVGDEAAVEELLAGDSNLMRELTNSELGFLADAAQDNDTEAVRLMLKYQWPVDGGRKETPLHWAAFHGNLEMVRTILQHNPHLETKDPAHHGTPLGWAFYGKEHGWFSKTGNYLGVIEALRAAGAQPVP